MNFSNYTKPSDALKINIDSTQFHQLTSIILWLVPNSVQNKNQLFCTTATKVILPSTTYEESADDTFALYVLLIITNFCSRKNCIKKPRRMKIPVKRNLHMTCIM